MYSEAGIGGKLDPRYERDGNWFAGEESCVQRLAQFFPGVMPLRVPMRVSTANGSDEQTVIEYGTSREALFASRLPLELGERLRLRNADGSLNIEALVVAFELQGGATAVAARFIGEVANWVVQ